MGWLYITYSSNNTTLILCLTLWPSTPTTTDLNCTKLTSHLFLHNLSHRCQPCTPSPNTRTHNILLVEISIVKTNCTWFDSINPEIAMASGSARKHPQWSKVNHPRRLVICYEKAPVAELNKMNGIYWIMDNNSKGSWIKKNAPIRFYKKFAEVTDVSYNLEYRKPFVCNKWLQQIKNQGCLSKRSAVSVWYHCRRISIWQLWGKKMQLSCVTQNNLWSLAKKNSMERILYRDGIAVYCWVTKTQIYCNPITEVS